MRLIAIAFLLSLATAASADNWSSSFNNVWDFANKANGTREVVTFSETDVDGPDTPAGPETPLITSEAADDTETPINEEHAEEFE